MPYKDKKQIALYVPVEYPFKGSQIKRELDEFFQWIWDNTKTFQKFEKANPAKAKVIMEILGKW